MLQWEVKEADPRRSDLNDAAREEVEENESFMHFIENYEQAYTYSEEHSESGTVNALAMITSYLLVC